MSAATLPTHHAAAPVAALGNALLLRPVAPPDADAVWSTSARAVLLAAHGGGWRSARVLAWRPCNPTGKPVLWRCAIDLGQGRAGWFAYDARLLRPLVPDAAAR